MNIPAKAADICAKAVQMEAQSEALMRSKVELSCEGDRLKMIVIAGDLSAMRAALNTYLRWISMCIGLVEGKN